ncbi:MAG: thiosulfate oxidation carrier complex protein SoxZ [Rhodomicrobium sp.]|nr:thiosulfate oxidation carrier complex protein SoxZ [Rhodomicrobium sp.]
MGTPTPRVRVPATAKAGEIIEIKTIISHDMESGQRKDKDGKPIPRKIINKFTAKFNGKEFLSVDWYSAVSANPYQSFYFRAKESGTLDFVWKDDDGSEYKSTHQLKVA